MMSLHQITVASAVKKFNWYSEKGKEVYSHFQLLPNQACSRATKCTVNDQKLIND